ncbi:hypothetical protein MCUN1_003408 [Malassezia cuniculi]|uniref:LysM domain-containing protein n=1 Tax=Malassezia cuniculi TaxID=948313 RepID=A0AAF0J7Y4_9BASI|nr:hypothetical protein MCUN1_003408 [Malassezia cuniculi]
MAQPLDRRVGARARRRNVAASVPASPAWMRDSPHEQIAVDTPRSPPPRSKGHAAAPQISAIDRLESWLGIKDDANASATTRVSAGASGIPGASGASVTPRNQAPRPAEHTKTPRAGSAAQVLGTSRNAVDVLVHPVAPTDTLPSIALKYGADVNVLRRSNRLWLGDAVQMRTALYIPVDCCLWKPPHADIRVLERAPDGSLHTQIELVGEEHAQQVAVAAADETDLLFFDKNEDYGETGLDDLLGGGGTGTGTGTHTSTDRKRRAPAAALARESRTPPRTQSDDPWQPNVWHVDGSERRRAVQRAPPRPTVPVPRGDVLFNNEDDLLGLDEPDSAAPKAPVRAYVSHTTDLLDDISQSLAPNTGAAAHWVRPIHDSLPNAPRPRPQPGRTVGGIFGDMVRGRISVEDAFGAAMQELQSPRSRNAVLPL